MKPIFQHFHTLIYCVANKYEKVNSKKTLLAFGSHPAGNHFEKKKFFPLDRKIFLQNIFRFIYQWDKICIEFTAINQISFYTFIHSFFIPQKVYR